MATVIITSVEEEDTNEGEHNNSTGTTEMEDIELRREESASTESQESDSLQANVNNMKQWQIMDRTLARAQKAAEENETDASIMMLYRKWTRRLSRRRCEAMPAASTAKAVSTGCTTFGP